MISTEEMLNLFKDDVNDTKERLSLKQLTYISNVSNGCSQSHAQQHIEPHQNLATKYGNYFVSILNQQHAPTVRRFFEELCTPTARITLKVHGPKNHSQYPLNHFGTFTSADLSMEQFILLLSNYWEIAPDEFTELLSSHYCSREEMIDYVFCFRSLGTIITRDSLIGIGDMNGQLCDIRSPSSDILQRSVMEHFSRSFITEGSFILSRNQQGRIKGIEFYYEFII